jgi:hypothetical protein
VNREAAKRRRFQQGDSDEELTRGQVYALVFFRAQGCCELCGCRWRRMTGGADLHPHHVWKRGHIAAVPARYCDTEDSIIGVCGDWPEAGYRGCHSKVHEPKTKADYALVGQAEGMALERFARRHQLERELTGLLEWRPLDIMRELARIVQARKRTANELEEEQSA